MAERYLPRLTTGIVLLAMVTLSSRGSAQTTQPATPLIQLRGDSAALGAAHGSQLAEPIHGLAGKFLDLAFGAELHQSMARSAVAFTPMLRPEHLAEIKALAAASKVDEAQIMLTNSFLDLMPMTACSSISIPADGAPDHVARFARNLDFPTYGVADGASVVLVYHPSDRYGFLTIGWPGMIGAVSGMNEHGLTLANMEIDREGSGEPKAMPYALLYRTVLERCKTVDQAIDLLKNTPRQTPNNLMLMDATGNRAVAEITPDAVVIRPGKDHTALISTNHHRGEDTDSTGRCKRYDYLHDTSIKEFGKLDRAALQSMLKHVQQEEMTMQSMIFEPANRVIYLATGMDAATREMKRIELKQYFVKPE